MDIHERVVERDRRDAENVRFAPVADDSLSGEAVVKVVLAVPRDLTPEHLNVPYNSAQHWTMSSAMIRAELGYAEPVPAALAIARTIEWMLHHPEEAEQMGQRGAAAIRSK